MKTTIKNENLVKTGTEILNLKITKMPTLVDPIIQKTGVIALAGSSDLGKSFFLLQLCDAIVNGDKTFLGMPLNTVHKSAIYLATEDDEFSICPRLTNLSRNRSEKKGYDNLSIFFDAIELEKKLTALLDKNKSDLVVIDTFGDIFEGELNQSNKVRPFIQKYKNLARKYQTLVLFNHHCGKKNDQRSPHKDNLLGSQGFESSMRTVFELRQDFNFPSKRHLCIVKGNNLHESLKGSSFELEFSFQNGFSSTGNRVPFENLVKSEIVQVNTRIALKEKVLALKATGLSIGKIAEQLKAEGHKISRSTVGSYCKGNNPTIQLPIADEMDGQENTASDSSPKEMEQVLAKEIGIHSVMPSGDEIKAHRA